MLIEKQIGALTFTPEVKRVTFNGSQVREFRDTMEKMLAVVEEVRQIPRVHNERSAYHMGLAFCALVELDMYLGTVSTGQTHGT